MDQQAIQMYDLLKSTIEQVQGLSQTQVKELQLMSQMYHSMVALWSVVGLLLVMLLLQQFALFRLVTFIRKQHEVMKELLDILSHASADEVIRRIVDGR